MELNELLKLLKIWKKEKVPKNYINKLKLAIKLKQQPKKDKKFIFNVSSLTCWDGLEYCCKSGEKGKSCFWRDLSLDLMDISQSEYENHKSDFRAQLVVKRD